MGFRLSLVEKPSSGMQFDALFLLVVSSHMCVAEENKEQENEMRDLQQRPAAGGGG